MDPQIPAPVKRIKRKLLLPLIVVIVAGVAILLRVHSILRLAQSVDATMELRHEVALARLSFHDYILSTNAAERAAVSDHIRSAAWYDEALLAGGENAEGHFVPIHSPEGIALADAVAGDLHKLADLLENQLAAFDKTGLVSGYSEMSGLSESILHNIDALETIKQKKLGDAVNQSSLLILLVLACAVLAQAWASERLRHSFKALEASRQKLAASNQQLAASEQQLRASNQQLVASEQQLRASNQQLTASEQQLQASNQQLAASEQQLRASNEELRIATERMKLHAEQTAMGVIDWDVTSRAVSWNAAAEKIFGYKEDEALGKSFRELIVPPEARDVTDGVWRQLLNCEGGVHSTNINVTKDGSRLTCEWFNTPLRKDDGTVIGVASLVTDITERLQALEREDELKKQVEAAERFRALAVLSGGVAHDLNNVLGPLVSLPDIVKEDIEALMPGDRPDKKDAVEALDVMQQAAERAAAVVKDLLDLGRPVPEAREELPWSETIEAFAGLPEIKRLAEGREDVNLSLDLCDIPLYVTGSRSHLLRVLVNLVKNAGEAMPDGGDIVLVTRLATVSDAGPNPGASAGIPAGCYAVLDVIDSGIGIEQEDMARIFDPFFTRNRRGTKKGSGLGLASVFHIVKDHGGYIDVCSERGRGTSISVYLPVSEGSASGKPEGAHASHLSALAGTERVLVVDDEPSQCFIAARSLTRYGYQVKTVTSGEDALRIFREAASKKHPPPFDLLVLDIFLGDGMDGLATFEQIQKLYPGQRGIVASGHASDAHHGAAGALGLTWVSKPYLPEELAMAARQALDADAAPAAIS